MKAARCALIAVLLMLAGCFTQRDYGYGECYEYKPFCVKGCERCIVDDKGCEFCSCEDACPDSAGWPPRIQERN